MNTEQQLREALRRLVATLDQPYSYPGEIDAALKHARNILALILPMTPTSPESPDNLRRDASEAEQVCHQTYAALGTMLVQLAEQGHPQAEKLMDNLSEARLVHKDVLPFADVPGVKEVPRG